MPTLMTMLYKPFHCMMPVFMQLQRLGHGHIKTLTISAMLVMLSACATLEQPLGNAASAPRWLAHQQQLQTLHDWQMHGKVSFQYGDRRSRYKLTARCHEQNISFNLYTPTGQQVLEFFHVGTQSWLKDQYGNIHYADTPEALIEQALGIELPLSSLCNWSKGLPDSTAKTSQLTLSVEQRLRNLQQLRWRIEYLDYTQVGDFYLPAKLHLQKGKLKIVLLIKRWGLD